MNTLDDLRAALDADAETARADGPTWEAIRARGARDLRVRRQRRWVGGTATLVATAAAITAFVATRPSDSTRVSPLTTETTVPNGAGNGTCSASRYEGVTAGPPLQAVPEAVRSKVYEIMDALADCDFERLEALADPQQFTYSFGANGTRQGAGRYWREAEARGEEPLLKMYERLLGVTPVHEPYAENAGAAIWRFGDPNDEYALRIGITNDGEWIYAVAGD
jgi:hypothetical protein